MLTEVDETGCSSWPIRHGIIDDGTQSRYFPDLDYIARGRAAEQLQYPRLGFRRTGSPQPVA